MVESVIAKNGDILARKHDVACRMTTRAISGKTMTGSLLTYFPAASGSAFVAAREIVLASGQSVLQSEQGYIYEVFPDGRRLRVKKIEPPTPVVSGSKFTIR